MYNLVVYMYGDIYVFNSYFEYLNNDYKRMLYMSI